MNHLVIMAGGVGSRFWPMSTEEKPKQFIDVMGTGRSLLQQTVARFKGIVPAENVWVVTSGSYAGIVKEQLPEVPVENILLEPCRRNTAPCVAYVSWKIQKRDSDANIVVTPSDHLVADVIEFQRVVKQALEFTAANDALLTLGMKPSRPETGYGYIEACNQIDNGQWTIDNEILSVKNFREKPNLETAKEYISHDNFFWNSGIFIWSVKSIVNAFRKYQPELTAQFDAWQTQFDTEAEQALIDEHYAECKSISVDYAIMEHADNIHVLPADFGWSDLGTWGSLHELSEKDEAGNAKIGADIRLFDTKNTVVHTTEEKRVLICGLDGYIVAEHGDALLICPLEREQEIKEMNK